MTAPGLHQAAHRAAELVVAAALVLGSMLLWIGLPAGWLWLVSRLIDEYPSIWAAAVFGAPVTMALWGYGLARLNAVYLRMAERDPGPRRAAWLASLSGERSPRRAPRGVLDVSMAVSVVLAVLALTIWFFFFAENYSPGRVL